MIEKNQELTGVIEGLGSNGEGVLRADGCVIFIPNALTGEKIKFKLLKVAKNYAFGKVLEICSPAEERVRPKCAVFGKCGGCQLQHLAYREQLKVKAKTVRDCFQKIAYIALKPYSVSASDFTYGYRNKLQVPIAETVQGTKIGFFAEGSHRLIPIDDCPIHKEWAAVIIGIVKDYIEKFNVAGYSEFTGGGLLRHLVVREIEGKLIITLVATSKDIPHVDYLVTRLKERFGTFSLFVNVNKGSGNVIFGKQFYVLFGAERMTATYNGLVYEFGPESFLQINDGVCRKLYDKVVEQSLLGEDRVVIDAYSGAGIMTALLARKAKKAIGIECVKEAVECANRLKELNSLDDKMENICGVCEEELPHVIARLKSAGEKVSLVVDPPRKGCDLSVINAILKSGIERVVYVSCNPATLARDVGLLTGTLKEYGNEIKKNTELFSELENEGKLQDGLLPFYNGKEFGVSGISSDVSDEESDKTCEVCEKDSGIKEACNESVNLTESLKSDASESMQSGYYEVKYMQCFDMFSMTKHVETLVALTRKN